MNKDILKAFGFGQAVDFVEAGICPFCHVKVDTNKFRDEISRKEFKISGLCQPCQDSFFGKED